eukprot:11648516-Heterocapsa_arctica.AAC.1
MYGLQDVHSNALRKPWRVVTTSQALADVLTCRCDRGHRHGVTCGVKAKCSAYYTPCLVEIIGNAACGATSPSSTRWRTRWT